MKVGRFRYLPLPSLEVEVQYSISSDRMDQ